MANEITPTGAIASFPANVPTLSSSAIRNLIETALNQDDYTFTWTQRRSQPYQGTLDDGVNLIDVYIYAWNITPAYRTNPSEKRIQLNEQINDIGINRAVTATQKTVILGIYNWVGGNTPLIAAWDRVSNINHKTKSCYVQVEDIAQAITDDFVQVADKNGNPIYTMKPQKLGDYISELQPNSTIGPIATGSTASSQLTANNKSKKKQRVIKSIAALQTKIASLSTTEKDSVVKSRVGQGYFRDLLIEKYSCKCVLCNITTRSMLYASHIKAWKDSSNTEKLDVENGLLLCAHHDGLFDKHLITFDASGNPLVSTTLSTSEQTSLNTGSIPSITMSADMAVYMANHRSKLK